MAERRGLIQTTQFPRTFGSVRGILTVEGLPAGPNLSDLSATTFSYVGDVAHGRDWQGISFSNDGSRMFVSNDTAPNIVIAYDLSTPWDVSSRTHSVGEDWDSPTAFGQPQDHVWNADGTRIIQMSSGSDDWVWSDLSTAFDLTTTGTNSSQAITDTTIPTGIAFNSDGTELFLGTLEDTVIKFVLSTPYDPSTKDAGTVVLTATPEMTQLGFGMTFAPDGLRFYACDVTDSKIHQYNLTVAYDLTTATHQSIQTIAAAGSDVAGMHMRPEGTEIYVCHSTGNKVITRWA